MTSSPSVSSSKTQHERRTSHHDFLQNRSTKLQLPSAAMSMNERLPKSTYNPSTSAPATTAPSRDQMDITEFTPPAGTHWPSTHFVLAAGTATFQPSTAKVLVVEDTAQRGPNSPREAWSWFLPRGRKDQGETLEQCAVRETLEEAGYAAALLSLSVPTLQPKNAEAGITHSEAFHIQLLPYLGRRRRLPKNISDVLMYLSFWYLCTIPADAVRATDYGAHFVGAHEKGYNSELVDVVEAVRLLSSGRFEYCCSEKEPGGGLRGRLVEVKTGHEVHWEDLDAQDSGGVEALVVALGWESVRAAWG